MLTTFALERSSMRRILFKIVSLLISATVCATEVIETGAVLGEYSVIRWMDNQRVIFLAASGQTCDRKDKPDSYKQPLNRIAIFDTRTRQLNWYGDVGINGLCYADGNIAYARRLVSDGLCPKDDWIYLRGRFGEEKEQQPTTSVNAYSCLPEAEKNTVPSWLESARKSGRVFRALKPEHGWLEMAIHPRYGIRANPTFPITVHPPGLPDSKGYPVSDVFQKHLGDGFSLWSPEYVPFKDAYFILLDYYQSSRPPGSPLGWWLYPDGRVEEVTFSNPANQTWGNLVFTRAGNLLIRMSFTKSNFHEAGIYLDDVKGPLKLVSGRVQDKAFVSPDGCKVAFGNDTRRDIVPGTERHKLQVIDVCPELKGSASISFPSP